jgi:Protein of unknown function (DUF2752)
MSWRWQRLGAGEPDYEALFGLVALAAVGLGWLAAPHLHALPIGCAFKAVTGWPCVTCGGTRAVVALAGGELLSATRANPLVTGTVLAITGWAPWALATAAFGWPRLRVVLRPEVAGVARVVAVALASSTWLFLILDGR